MCKVIIGILVFLSFGLHAEEPVFSPRGTWELETLAVLKIAFDHPYLHKPNPNIQGLIQSITFLSSEGSNILNKGVASITVNWKRYDALYKNRMAEGVGNRDLTITTPEGKIEFMICSTPAGLIFTSVIDSFSPSGWTPPNVVTSFIGYIRKRAQED